MRTAQEVTQAFPPKPPRRMASPEESDQIFKEARIAITYILKRIKRREIPPHRMRPDYPIQKSMSL